MVQSQLAELASRRPTRYLPFLNGRYEVKPGLHRFGTDFGNGDADQQVFQFDHDFLRFRQAKLAARSEDLSKYVLIRNNVRPVAQAVAHFLFERLSQHNDAYFRARTNGQYHYLDCDLVDERLVFDHRWELVVALTHSAVTPPYSSAFDALACQIQEDLAVTSVSGTRHWLSALHVCLPSHWSPESKIGRTFAEIHAPVAGMEPINRRQSQYVQQMVEADQGLVRFVWGLQADDRLNCHPDTPRHNPGAVLDREYFDSPNAKVFVRVERQTIWGLPAAGATVFTIRPYLCDSDELQTSEKQALISAVRSMSPGALSYKGLDKCHERLIDHMSS